MIRDSRFAQNDICAIVCKLAETNCGEELKSMAELVCEVLLTEAPLDAPPRNHDTAGAVVDFWGVVRKLEDGREIEGIDYQAHRHMAEHQLRQIAEQAVDKFRLQLVRVYHRIGFIAVGEPSLFLRASSLHREEAFCASQWIVTELKKKVPIWKRPRFKMEKQLRAAHRAAATV
jgi:molybdopterin synthase catalytic subunit